MNKILILLITVISISFLPKNLLAYNKVMITTHERTPTNPDDVELRFYDTGKYKDCEEIGIVMTNAYTIKGFLKKVKKKAASVGATDVLFTDKGRILFFCPK